MTSIPIKSSGKETATWRSCKKRSRLCKPRPLLRDIVLAGCVVQIVFVLVPVVREGWVDDGGAVEIPHAAENIRRDRLAEQREGFGIRRGIRRRRWKNGLELLIKGRHEGVDTLIDG